MKSRKNNPAAPDKLKLQIRLELFYFPEAATGLLVLVFWLSGPQSWFWAAGVWTMYTIVYIWVYMGIPKKPKGRLNEETTQLGETTLQFAAMQRFYIRTRTCSGLSTKIKWTQTLICGWAHCYFLKCELRWLSLRPIKNQTLKSDSPNGTSGLNENPSHRLASLGREPLGFGKRHPFNVTEVSQSVELRIIYIRSEELKPNFYVGKPSRSR